ncbi:hypothetical protein [Bradyrhizobium sp. NP1]|uniref:hypothetical protein n=1 Tax=Bradyrhizobium sp. NP1 TaxID=3049772 RepID=UPI0025A6489E|nr:hypothetical protein [Bradyrhizobium sp. NP1]WJR74929.1 hypothetical protein QOU61_19060 [Bradyrhizobium sp. NP1]
MRKARRKTEGDGPLTLSNTDRTLLAFGRAMAAWARIEVGFYAWFEHITVFDMRQAKPIYYSATNFKSRLDLLRAALDGVRTDHDEEAFIKAAMDVVIKYNSFRNKLAHGEFTFDGLLIEGKHVDRQRARAEAISVDQLQRFANLATEFAAVLYRAHDLAFGPLDDDDELSSLEMCTERIKSLPRTFVT